MNKQLTIEIKKSSLVLDRDTSDVQVALQEAIELYTFDKAMVDAFEQMAYIIKGRKQMQINSFPGPNEYQQVPGKYV